MAAGSVIGRTSNGEWDLEEFAPSRRTRTLLVIFRAVSVAGFAVVIGLIVSLVGNLLFGWDDAPVSQMSVLIVYAALAVIMLRGILYWSIKVDKRGRA
jgi:hypothetical protein